MLAARILPLVAALAAAAPQRYDIRNIRNLARSGSEGRQFVQAYLSPEYPGATARQARSKSSTNRKTRSNSRYGSRQIYNAIRNDDRFYSDIDDDRFYSQRDDDYDRFYSERDNDNDRFYSQRDDDDDRFYSQRDGDSREGPNFISAYGNDDSDEYRSCGQGRIRRVDGKCVKPSISRNIYFYNTPEQNIEVLPPSYIPEPKVHVNYVFVKTPEAVNGPPPLVVPPAEEKTLVYVLNKNDEQEQQIIELDTVPDNPEVFFVNYEDGENPVLPGGIDLRTALKGANGDDSFERDSLYGSNESDSPAFFIRDKSAEKRRGGYRVRYSGRRNRKSRGRRFSNEFDDDRDLRGSFSANTETVILSEAKTINAE